MGAAQQSSLKKMRIFTWSVYVCAILPVIYSFYENFSPCVFVAEYGFLVWLPVALGFFIFVIQKFSIYDERIAGWKNWAGIIIILVAALMFGKVAIIYGILGLFNRFAGTPFEAQTIVESKHWSTRFCQSRLNLLHCNTGKGGICVDESVWKEVNEGNVVIVSGVQTILGQSIDTVTKTSFPGSATAPTFQVESETMNRSSAVPSSSQQSARDEALINAVKGERFQGVDWSIYQGGNVNARGRRGTTALQYAAMNGGLNILKLLLGKGARIDLKDETGDTALFFACAFGHLDIAELLAEKGAKIDEANANGMTPLIVASLTGRTDVVKFLLDKGAEVNTRDRKGTTALVAAKKQSLRPQPEVVKLLEERGAEE